MVPFISLSKKEQACLLDVARQSIAHGLAKGCALPITLEHYPKRLKKNDASFVTLTLDGQLRGCVGTLSAYQPLVTDVAEHSFMAGFKDRRFIPVSADEVDKLHYHISILEPATPLAFKSEAELLEQLEPFHDGLILKVGSQHQATFLPSVWQSLPGKERFLQQLKIKAGFDKDYWSHEITAFKYRVFEFEDNALASSNRK